MKHIKKRFLFQTIAKDFSFDPLRFEEIRLNKDSNQDYLKDRDGSYTLIQTEKDILIGGFVHNVGGKNYAFPIPDLTLVYFDYAQKSVKVIESKKKQLLEKVDLSLKLSEPAINEIFSFYSVTSGFIIFLFTSIESFANSLLPADYKFIRKSKSKTEVYDQFQIQEHLDFKTKITKVLSDISKKDFFISQTKTNQMIWSLKEFRDSIIHTKHNPNPFDAHKLIKKALTFKYMQTLDSVAKFMNFYKPDYIVECDCGNEY